MHNRTINPYKLDCPIVHFSTLFKVHIIKMHNRTINIQVFLICVNIYYLQYN